MNDANVELQRCTECGSADVNNIVVDSEQNQQRVYCRCSRCKAMIAWCDLKTYFPAKHSLEHYLSNHRGIETDSGRRWLDRFNKARASAEADYQQALVVLGETPNQPDAKAD